MRALTSIAAVTWVLAGTARADLRFAIGNDTFSEATPPFDDNGFTNDLELAFWRPWRGYLVGARIFDRWITEDTPIGGLRRDVVEVVASAARTWGAPGVRSLTIDLLLGPTFTGNLGGRGMQNAFHTLCACGRKLDEGLQDRYEGDGDIGLLAGGRVVGSRGGAWLQGYGVADAQLAVGTGVSAIEGAIGGRLLGSSGDNRFGMHVELAGNRFHVDDDRLAFRGSYRSGWQTAYRIGVHYARGRIGLDYEYRANEGGSGEPIGVFAVTFKQAGSAF